MYVEDVTDAMAKCATSATGRGTVFELGGPDVYTFKELMGKVRCVSMPLLGYDYATVTRRF